MKISAYLAGALMTLALMSGCSRPAPYRQTSGAVWATTYHITYRSDKLLDDSIQAVFRRVEESLSPFNKSSNISRINRGETSTTDSLFNTVFRASKEVNRWSGGLFDPTVAPLVNIWGFGYGRKSDNPTDEEIAEALDKVGIYRCSIAGDALVRPAGMEFDFSAITKGYGCDLVAEMLSRNGCEDYMVEIGGEITVSGVNPSGDKWHIMIDAPIENDSTVSHNRLALVAITDCGMATSGNYRNYHQTDSGNIGHTINPVTGRPALRSKTLSATVIAANAMYADALATACMAMQPDSALRMIEKAGCNASALLVIQSDSESEWQILTTSTFPEVIAGVGR